MNVPSAIAGFAMASLFIYLLYAQPHTRPTAAAAAAAALTVAACKWAGAAGIAVPVAALAGVAAGLAAGALPRAPHAPRRAHQQASRDHGYGSASAHGREGRPPMTQSQFLILWLTSFAFTLACRVLPALALRGRPLSPRATEALGYIPPAAFAALVANDLLPPTMFDTGVWPGLMPIVAAGIVVLVAWRTRSMLWCCVSGVAAYVLLSLV